MNKVYIDGIAQTKFGKDERRLEVMLADVGREVLDKSKKKPDFVVVGNYNYQGYVGQASLDTLVSKQLGISSTTRVFQINRGSSTGAAAVELGYELAKSGKNVLIVSGEKMHFENLDRKLITKETSKVLYADDRKLGITMPIIAAIATTEYMSRYKISEPQIRRIFFEILNQNRKNGMLNEFAYFRNLVSEKDYFENEKSDKIEKPANPWIEIPLTTNDCAGTYNGAAAVLLTPKETDIELSGIRGAFSAIQINKMRTLTSLDATVDATIQLFKDTNLNPHEIDIVELHDAFAPVPIIAAEDIGLVSRGKGYELVLNGKNIKGKKVFYNLSGGFLSKTHPIAASGTAQLVELVLQMRGQNQYSKMLQPYQNDINYGLWFSMHGFGFHNVIGIIEKTNTSSKREGLNKSNLPKHFKVKTGIFDKYHRKERVIGMTNLSVDSKEYNKIGIVRTKDGHLQLGYLKGDEPFLLGKKVKVVQQGEETLFIPVSDSVFDTIRHYINKR